jgi:hypothetical protein
MDGEPTPETYCYDWPSWREGYRRGHCDGYDAGAHCTDQGVRTSLWHELSLVAADVGLGLRHDCETALAALRTAMDIVAPAPRPREDGGARIERRGGMRQRYAVETVRGALQDAVADWMARYSVDREVLIWELRRMAAEVEFGLNCNRAWRLRRLEEALEVWEAAGADCRAAHSGRRATAPGSAGVEQICRRQHTCVFRKPAAGGASAPRGVRSPHGDTKADESRRAARL